MVLFRFGFRPMPQLVLSAKPKVGVRTVNITRITDFIEHKIQMELQVQTLRINAWVGSELSVIT